MKRCKRSRKRSKMKKGMTSCTGSRKSLLMRNKKSLPMRSKKSLLMESKWMRLACRSSLMSWTRKIKRKSMDSRNEWLLFWSASKLNG